MSIENPHGRGARATQLAIYRSMTPQQRLHQALELNAMVRELLAAGFRQRHPDWTQTQVEAAVARRIRDADTG